MATHQSVLLHESITGLAIKSDGIYFDGTFGRGGHSKEILRFLNEEGRLYAIDKDLDAIMYAKEHFDQDKRFHIFQGSYAKIEQFATEAGVLGMVDGILLDLGVSSPQLDNPERGFSFMQQGPLDMRMDRSQPMSAARFVNEAETDEMTSVFKLYGEERFAGRIAKAIVTARNIAPITTTLQLAEIVKEANPKWEKHKHPATRVFQAIRIYVNQELNDLERCLEQCIHVLAPKGRLVVISFHSLEDRIVKQFMKNKEEGAKPPPEVPIRYKELKTNFKRIGKAIMPQQNEISENVRARSAVLRIGEKLA
ncbi:16S rRNA (cytosine(1402)-N(4))-methyltransferase RsmH [Legionella longbeachae]|uniref:Ribosomal RNA small subunit methyltransferase H n=1 Tax=Legionella longbeachae serogroup 1 (strain NSW150) TaxID=661367 RepID=D3HQN0_LEGLN|nr:16S rRNA (cytosine(1402)-N(4))-methyltransferase RsmH [Legionella longbeachae]VEE01716.1 S-adenosyl-dependent methyltransferase activity on membrane-located substrates [Legionella oakridgensis]HBD7396474.1 16S rRNA (cytosine(1402)-N(4))-methyltransferase RsmH [Legionella pneumophila]ARB94060.1 16S rRNA (cytosine(1402)-N(4))-methyltransferase RsmH [Legionella longbeachae]ARM34866.1 16S rRNA (cytosine(1402)-N(4))-methyltransferase RsmH [Legionella longbeachae]EEZ95686.1 S-adenosyl-methyltrans